MARSRTQLALGLTVAVVVERGRNGLLVRPRDAAALAEGMLQMVSEPERLEEMGRQSRAMAEECFDVRELNRTILAAMGLA